MGKRAIAEILLALESLLAALDWLAHIVTGQKYRAKE